MYRTSIGAGAFIFFALLFIAGDNRDAAAARILYGICFAQSYKCMARCNTLDAQAFGACSSTCLRAPRCESDRHRKHREASNGNLPESALPNARLPDSNLPSDNLPDSRLP